MSAFLRKYATATTLNFPLISYNSVSFSSTASLTTADMKLSLNEGAFTTVGTAIVNEGSYGYSYTCTTADLTAARVAMVIKHTAATPTFEDTMILIETYGNTAAQHTWDFSLAQTVTVNTISAGAIGAGMLSAGAFAAGFFSAGGVAAAALSAGGFAAGFLSAGGIAASAISAGGIATAAITSAKIAAAGLDSTNFGVGFISAGGVAAGAISVGAFVAGAVTASGSFPANFPALTITAVTGLVSISTAALVIAGTVNDKTGYSLTQTFPTNFADLSITVTTGLVSISTAASVNVGTVSAAAVTSIWAVAAVEPTGAPTITATFRQVVSWLHALSRNKITQTSTLQTLFSDTTTVTISASTIADDGSVFTRSVWTV